jgi:hypothetical protein
MRWLSLLPSKATLALLFTAAKWRVAEQSDDLAELPTARVVSATEELNQIADDVREAQALPETSPSDGTGTGQRRSFDGDAEKHRTLTPAHRTNAWGANAGGDIR